MESLVWSCNAARQGSRFYAPAFHVFVFDLLELLRPLAARLDLPVPDPGPAPSWLDRARAALDRPTWTGSTTSHVTDTYGGYPAVKNVRWVVRWALVGMSSNKIAGHRE